MVEIFNDTKKIGKVRSKVSEIKDEVEDFDMTCKCDAPVFADERECDCVVSFETQKRRFKGDIEFKISNKK